VTEDDLPLLERWLMEPHVREWWDDHPGEPYPDPSEYRDVLAGEDPSEQFIIHADERPVGFIQVYKVDDDPEYAAAVDLGEPAAGVDIYLGEADMLHRGHGPEILRAFLRGVVFERYGDLCVIGPATANAAAIRAYEKVGFRHDKDVTVPGEKYPEHLMRLRREDLS